MLNFSDDELMFKYCVSVCRKGESEADTVFPTCSCFCTCTADPKFLVKLSCMNICVKFSHNIWARP